MRLMLQSFICPQLSSLSFTEQFAILADDLSCERSELFGKKLPLCRKTEGCWVPNLWPGAESLANCRSLYLMSSS